MRTIIDLPEKLAKELDAVAEKAGISRAEAVRRAVGRFVDGQRASSSNAAFGIWKSRRVEALDYEDSLRGEWNR